ncbi:SPOR domain-containing protein, partial [bacterium]|nr:SPOR domain-containing protein [bacterium]
ESLAFSSVMGRRSNNRVRHREKVRTDYSPAYLYDSVYVNRDFNVVIDSLKNIIQKYPNTIFAQKAHFDIIRQYYISSDYKSVISESEYFLNSYTNSEFIDDVYYFLGLSYMGLYDKDNAFLCFDKIIYEIGETSDKYSYALMSKGDMYFKLSNYNEALRFYNKALECKTNFSILSALNYKLGLCHQKLGNWNNAKEQFNIVVERYPLSNEVVLVENALNKLNVYSFSVQVGSFSSQDNAYKLKKRLENKGYVSYVVDPKIIGDKLYRVKVGQFDARQDAIDMQRKLKAHEGLSGRIVP